MTAAAATKSPPEAKKAVADEIMKVLDTTAIDVPRTHHQILDGRLTPFVFEPNKPLDMPRAHALKFLGKDGFLQVDAKGAVIQFKRPPLQPHQLGAGEAVVVALDETIARFDELSQAALQARALALVGGERFNVPNPSKNAIVKFLIEAKPKPPKPQRKPPAAPRAPVDEDSTEGAFEVLGVGMGEGEDFDD